MYDFEFTPKKEEELMPLLKEGTGSFEVIKAEKKLSKNGNPMIQLLLKCWDSEGNQGTIFEYLILNDNVFSQRKIRHFCYCVGLEKQYEEGRLNSFDCENKYGNLIIGIQKDKSGTYPDKNCVYDFIVSLEKNNESNNINALNDDIPFL